MTDTGKVAAAYLVAGWAEAKLLAEAEGSTLLSRAALDELDRLDTGLDAESQSYLTERRLVLERAMAEGVPVAFAPALGLPPLDGIPPAPLTVLEGARTPEGMQALLKVQPALRNVLEHLNLLQSMLGTLEQNPSPPEKRAALRAALVVAWRDWDPAEWLRLVWDLAETTLEHAEDDPDLEAGIAAATMALRAGEPDATTTRTAELERNLGLAYGARSAGDRAQNLDDGIEHLQRAVSSMRVVGSAELTATVEMELGRAWSERLAGDPEENFSETVRHLTAAMEVFDREHHPVAWATSQTQVGVAYFKRRGGDRAAHLEHAVAHYDQALSVLARDGSPDMWARAMQDSAAALLHRVGGDRAANVEEAIRRFEAAAKVVTLESDARDWASIQHNLGLAWDRRLPGDRASNAACALEHFNRALTVRSAESLSAQRRETLAAVGHLHFRDRRWDAAAAAYASALAIAKREVGLATSLAGRRERIPQLTLMSTRAAFCLVELERFEEAFARLDAGKTLLLSAYHAAADLGPGRLFVVDSDDEGEPRLCEALERIPTGGALIAPLVTHRGSCAFVIPHGRRTLTHDDVLPLPDLDMDILQALLIGDGAGGGWLARHQAPQGPAELQRWGKETSELGRRLWDVLIGPIAERLATLGIKHEAPVLLLPHGGLGVLPLQAAGKGDDCFLDLYSVAQLPSLHGGVNRSSRALSPALVVADTTLTYANLEADLVAASLGTQPLRGADATVAAVIVRARDAGVLHFACHGAYNWDDPLESALLLAKGELLTWRRIVGELELRDGPLATLSACETGIADTREMPDEVIGLATGFLVAGASGVVSSLWEVDDAATSLLMGDFYRRITEQERAPAAALREAQLWLRDLDPTGQGSAPYANPYYWAAWVYTGG